MSEPLFLPASVQMEKVAFSVKLGSDSTTWPTEILKEAYKQLPYLHKYEADVDIDRLDEARGYAVGKLLVYPARMQKHAASKSEQLISFPLVVRDNEMSPLDVYNYKDAMYPESESSVHETLFRPGVFERSAPSGQFGSQNLSSQIDPPGARLRQQNTMHKTSSVSLWKAASASFDTADVESFKEDLRNDHTVRNAFVENESLRLLLSDLLSIEKTASADHQPAPTVIQFVEDGIGYIVKSATHKGYSPMESRITRFEAQDLLSEKSMSKLSSDGHITLTIDPVIASAPKEKMAQVAERAGVYTTYASGREVTGVVVPNMVTFDGRSIDSQVFAGSDCHAVQEKIAGVFRNDVSIPTADPRGAGVFFYQEGPMAYATEPVEITNRVEVSYENEKVAQYVGKSLTWGTPISVTVLPGLRKVASIGDSEIAIPQEYGFLPLNGKQVGVAQSTEVAENFFTKSASSDSVEMISDGSVYSLRGLNADSVYGGEMLDSKDAEFALGALGVTGGQAQVFMKKASDRGKVRIPRTRKVVSLDTLEKVAKSSLVDVSHLKVDLTKEASVIVDKETADAILSLRFITPENVGVYVDYIPELEKVASKLAELLVASRLGMEDVKESAAKNAMTQVQSVIHGLEAIQARTQ